MLYKYRTGGNESNVIGLFKRDGQEGYHYRVIRIPDPPCRYDCVSSEICFICSRCTTRESGPVETATYVYFRHVRAKVDAYHTAPGIFGMTESRRHSFLVQSCCTKEQARKSPPASKPAAYSSIARFQPHTLNKQGIDRASISFAV